MAPHSTFRDESSKNVYLHAVEMTNASHNLTSKTAQLVAKHNLVEAITSIRGTLIPVKPIGPDFGNGFKWSGGSLAPDGRVFFAPHTSDHVSYIPDSKINVNPKTTIILTASLYTLLFSFKSNHALTCFVNLLKKGALCKSI
jgi:hypothetical protein